MRMTLLRTVMLGATLLAGCGDDATAPTAAIAGTYVATTLVVTPTGQAPIDVLAAGGSLGISIASDGATSGTLFLPSSVTGGAAETASQTGQAVIVGGSSVRFGQTADTFIRDLTFTIGTNVLTVTNQTAGNAAFTITLTRQ